MKTDIVLPFLRSLLPSNWTDYEPQNWTLLHWWETQNITTFGNIYENARSLVFDQCDRAFCDFLSLEGDPDLAGIGVSFAAKYLKTP